MAEISWHCPFKHMINSGKESSYSKGVKKYYYVLTLCYYVLGQVEEPAGWHGHALQGGIRGRHVHSGRPQTVLRAHQQQECGSSPYGWIRLGWPDPCLTKDHIRNLFFGFFGYKKTNNNMTFVIMIFNHSVPVLLTDIF